MLFDMLILNYIPRVYKRPCKGLEFPTDIQAIIFILVQTSLPSIVLINIYRISVFLCVCVGFLLEPFLNHIGLADNFHIVNQLF